MSTKTALERLEKLIAAAERQHRGLPLYKLNDQQRRSYNAWQAGQSADYAAYLAGTLPEQEPLDGDIARALGLDRDPITIPAITSEQEASQIYQGYLDNAL